MTTKDHLTETERAHLSIEAQARITELRKKTDMLAYQWTGMARETLTELIDATPEEMLRILTKHQVSPEIMPRPSEWAEIWNKDSLGWGMVVQVAARIALTKSWE